MSMNAVNSGPPEPENIRATVAGSSGPPYDAHMDRRLTVLETRFDTILPSLATKADLAELRVDFERMSSLLRVELHTALMSMIRWGVGIAIAVILGVAGQGIYLGKQIADQNSYLSKKIDDQNTYLSKKIDDQNTQLNKKIDDQNIQLSKKIDALNIHLSKQISDLSAGLPRARGPASSAPGRPPAAQAAPASAPQAGATAAPR